jgi:hypothetical protein
MTTIDVHFHVVPFGFLEDLRRDDFRAAVEVETLPDRDVLGRVDGIPDMRI